MKIKDQVLLLLEEHRGEFFSGQEVAERLSVTRAGVWKAVKALQKEGYAIEAVNNKGYILEKAPDVLSAAFIEQKLQEKGIHLVVQTERMVDSTNNVLKQYGAGGEKRDMVLLAEEQSAGRGRRGRSFYSPEGTGLYLSLLLHPNVGAEEGTLLTTLTAVAAAEAVEEIAGEPVQIKWVNDVWLRGKKISGILTEGSASMEEGKLEYVVVGIGINLYEPKGGFPEGIREVAGAVFTNHITRENLRNRLSVAFLTSFMKYYRSFPERSYLEAYRERCFAIGKKVRIIAPEGAQAGSADREYAKVLGIDETCHLHVQYEDGSTEFLSSGEISIRME